ncbi:MAG: helix-turn-helix domain-containing protein [Dysosmobacter sp.]|nr:helix-turn-helix domain-containing protein [Dysosmobacter sp.]
MYLKRVYDLREDHDLTQKAIAEYLSIHPNVYRRYEKGVREFPLEIVVKLADYYQVSTDYLLGRTDDPTPPSEK